MRNIWSLENYKICYYKHAAGLLYSSPFEITHSCTFPLFITLHLLHQLIIMGKILLIFKILSVMIWCLAIWWNAFFVVFCCQTSLIAYPHAVWCITSLFWLLWWWSRSMVSSSLVFSHWHAMLLFGDILHQLVSMSLRLCYDHVMLYILTHLSTYHLQCPFFLSLITWYPKYNKLSYLWHDMLFEKQPLVEKQGVNYSRNSKCMAIITSKFT